MQNYLRLHRNLSKLIKSLPHCQTVNSSLAKFILFIDIYLSNNYIMIMDTIKFEWDENKNLINQKKHKISFEEAQTVFFDTEALIIDDPEHSLDEDRFIILGLSRKANLLVVCHCYRESDTTIRIISARKATSTESKQYYKL